MKEDKDREISLKVASKTDLVSIFLSECRSWRSINASAYNNVKAIVTFRGELLDEQRNNFIAKATLTVKGLPEGESEEKEIVSIQCEYILTYSLREKAGLSKEEIKRFCNINAVYNAWPYWRELIQNMSNRMELPTLTLPLYKIKRPKIREKKKTK